MKSTKGDMLGKLQKALSVTYTERAEGEAGAYWPIRTMAHIKSLPPLYPQDRFLESLQQLVWRLSPVAVGLVLLLSAAIFQVDFTSDYELAKVFVEDPLDLSLLGEYTL